MGISCRFITALAIVASTTMTLQHASAAWINTTLVKDGDFSADPQLNGWTLLQTGAYYWAGGTSGSAGNPNPGVVLRTANNSGSKPSILVQEVTGLKPNTHYQLSVDTDFYGDSTPSDGAAIRLYLQIFSAGAALGDTALYSVNRNNTTNGWKTMTIEFTTGADQTAIQIRLRSVDYFWNPEGYFDNVVLREEAPVPEPAALGLMVLPVAGLLLRRR